MAVNAVGALMRSGTAEGVFPGGVLLAGVKGKIVYHEAVGYADLFSRRKMTTQTLFDLASLTKPLATALALFALHQEGRLGLDQPAAEILPGFHKKEKNRITLRHLLTHESGLPVYRPYYLALSRIPFLKRKSHLRALLAAETLESPPGTRTLYSDPGFMLLEWVVEAVSGKPLDVFLDTTLYTDVFSPGEKGLFFPGIAHAIVHESVAATEFCPWRNRVMIGQVHDENAHVVGGVAGHSGLFGRAMDIWKLLARLLEAFHGRDAVPLFSRELLKAAFYPSAPGKRALGFDTPSPEGPSCGRYFSFNTVGHLGFTGTSFWVDLDREVAVILLTNRIHPTRRNEKIRSFRPLLHDTVMEAAGILS